MSMNLQQERTRQAELAERLAYALLVRDPDPWVIEQTMAELRAARRQVEILDQQIAWESMPVAQCRPQMPAWTN